MTCEHEVLLPNCPTCGGSGEHDKVDETELENDDYRCYTCLGTGKVSPARLVALWRAVWDDGGLLISPKGTGFQAIVDATRAAFRSVKP